MIARAEDTPDIARSSADCGALFQRIMAEHLPKRLLSHVIAEWACALKYEDLSPAAIEAAKLFWFDSVGCALGGSQQDDARILLKHYRAMGGN